MSIIANGRLILYHHQYSYYSQKVVMALHEKNLPFESRTVNIFRGAQHEPWFLQINPKGEVPVLLDTGKVIPDSVRIIDYLEDNFSNGDTPRLIPMDQGPEIRQKVTRFRNVIEQIPDYIITPGSCVHSELVGKPKFPFIGPVRTAFIKYAKNNAEELKKSAIKNPGVQEVLLKKAAAVEENNSIIFDKNKYLKLMEQVDNVLHQVEEELAQHIGDKEQWWLCSDRFTVADVALTILLERLNQLGFDSRFWAKGKKPHLERYYERVRQRESYKKTIPTFLVHIKLLLTAPSPVFVGIGIATAIAVIIGGVYVTKRFIV